MSRTYRRKNGKAWWRNSCDNWWAQFAWSRQRQDHWKELDAGYRWSDVYLHTDNLTCAPYTQELKAQTTRARRNHTKMQLARIMRDPDVDFVCYEKEYLGYIWNWV